MLSCKLLTSSIILVTIYAIQADDSVPCLDIPPVENFRAFYLIGLWYGKYVQTGEVVDLECLRYIYDYPQPKNNDAFPVIALSKNISDGSAHLLFKNARLKQNGEGVSLSGYPFSIIGTDYNEWAIFLICKENENKRFVWVLTREKDPQQKVIDSAMSVLKENNISEDELRPIEQNDCPEDWSDAEKEEVDFTYDEYREALDYYQLIPHSAEFD